MQGLTQPDSIPKAHMTLPGVTLLLTSILLCVLLPTAANPPEQARPQLPQQCRRVAQRLLHVVIVLRGTGCRACQSGRLQRAPGSCRGGPWEPRLEARQALIQEPCMPQTCSARQRGKASSKPVSAQTTDMLYLRKRRT